MEGPTTFDRCFDIGEGNVSRAIVSRQAFRALLDRAALVSKPGDGAAKVLVAVARLATRDCAWIEGDLRVEVEGDHDTTLVTVLHEIEYGYREQVLPPVRLRAPFDELAFAIRTVSGLVAPLQLHDDGERLILVAPEDVRRAASRPYDLDKATEALLEAEARGSGMHPSAAPTAMPKPRESAAPPTRPVPDEELAAMVRWSREHPSKRPTAPRMSALGSNPTVVRVSTVRLEDTPEARREDHQDIDEAWEGDGTD